MLLWLLQATDPIPFGPSEWTLRQWLGFGAYALIFILFVFAVYRLARPVVESEIHDQGDEEDGGAPEFPPSS